MKLRLLCRFFIITLITFCSFGCTKEDQVLIDSSGVWKIKDGDALIVFYYNGGILKFAVNDEEIPVTLKELDSKNKYFNFMVNVNDSLYTIKNIKDKDNTSHLLMTYPKGEQDELLFVRKVSSSDMAAFSDPIPEGEYKYAEQGYDGGMTITKIGSNPDKFKAEINTVSKNEYHLCNLVANGEYNVTTKNNKLITFKSQDGLIINIDFKRKSAIVDAPNGYFGVCGMNGRFPGKYIKVSK